MRVIRKSGSADADVDTGARGAAVTGHRANRSWRAIGWPHIGSAVHRSAAQALQAAGRLSSCLDCQDLRSWHPVPAPARGVVCGASGQLMLSGALVSREQRRAKAATLCDAASCAGGTRFLRLACTSRFWPYRLSQPAANPRRFFLGAPRRQSRADARASATASVRAYAPGRPGARVRRSDRGIRAPYARAIPSRADVERPLSSS